MDADRCRSLAIVLFDRHAARTDNPADMALAYAYAARACDSERYAAAANANLDRLFDTVPRSPALYRGLAGCGFVLRESSRALNEELEGDATEDVDHLLVSALNQPEWGIGFDLINGAVGLGVYGLTLHDDGRGIALAARAVARLAEMQDERGWVTPAEVPKDRPERYDLGLAHGLAGVVAFLALCVREGVAVDGARPLLVAATQRLLACARPDGTFSYNAGGTQEARLAWCYGDLGTAAALLHASRALGDDDLRTRAIALAVGATSRSAEAGGVDTPWLCHGAAGIWYICARLFQATQDARLETLAERWLGETERLLAGREPVPDFLEGDLGVALALISGGQPGPSRWDRLLLLDL